ncbi:MAG: D-alanine--D-alanine ligase [Paramuribaculum sp.]|nr:D-alanine--D-alanine ligase [Paramuribaculum sp.]
MKTNIGVIFGGRSTEHEISIISACQAMAAIPEDFYTVTPIYISKEGKWFTGEMLKDVESYRNIPALLKNCVEIYMCPEYNDFNLYFKKKSLFGKATAAKLDIVIPVLHGANGEDGTIQGLLDLIGIPFAGCDVLASANGMDKITMKQILAANNIPVVDYVWFTDFQWNNDRQKILDHVEKTLSYPVIVKPSNLGSSIGINRAADREKLIEAINDATKYSSRIIVEKMIDNLKEINCSVLGDEYEYQTSVCEEPIKSGEFLSYTDKYLGGSQGTEGMRASEKRIPAMISDELSDRIRFLAGETFRVLSCHGVSRVDVIIDKTDDKVYVNEINTIPGSLSYYLWEESGIPFSELMERLIRLALKRQRERAKKTVTYDQNILALSGGTKGGKFGGKFGGSKVKK